MLLSIGAGAYGRRVQSQHVTICLFKNVTGEHCFACGGTRAAKALGQGQFYKALRLNPLMTVLLLVAVILFVLRYGFGVIVRLKIRSRQERIGWWVATGALASANWWYVIRTLY